MQPKITEDQWSVYENIMASGDIETAYHIACNAAQFYEEREDFKRAGMWLQAVARCSYDQGRYEEAAIVSKRAAQIQPDPHHKAKSLILSAGSHFFSLRYKASFELLKRAEEISHYYPKDTFVKAEALGCRAFLLLKTGLDAEQAVIDSEKAAELLLKSDFLKTAVIYINNTGHSLSVAGRPKEAERHLLTAMGILNKMPSYYLKANVFDSLGYAYMMMNRFTDAERSLRQSINLFGGIGNKAEMIPSLLNLSKLHERMHLYTEARQDVDRALKIAAEEKLDPLWLEAKKQSLNIESLIPRYSSDPRSLHGIIYTSSAMQNAMARLRNIAPTDEVVLLLGETGTGKELAARAIHNESRRRHAPFIPFNCSALSRDLVESRLFGHCKGAFTGADRNHEGVIRAAEGGTLFLDEIGDLSLESQGALLRFLQSGEIQPVGANRPINVNVRVIAATNRDLAKECEEGRFRRDLYHRLNGITLWLPPLRIRREDIPVLARHFAAIYGQQYGKLEPALSRSEISLLTEYEWPGNIRELESHIKRRILFGTELIDPVEEREANGESSLQLWRKLSEEEKRQRLIEALENNRGNVTRAAAHLGISRRTIQKLQRRIEQDRT